jgi:hypothetical protein
MRRAAVATALALALTVLAGGASAQSSTADVLDALISDLHAKEAAQQADAYVQQIEDAEMRIPAKHGSTTFIDAIVASDRANEAMMDADVRLREVQAAAQKVAPGTRVAAWVGSVAGLAILAGYIALGFSYLGVDLVRRWARFVRQFRA